MYPYLGDFPTGATIFIPFHTFNSSGASVTISGLAVTDIEVYKGASMTQRASDAGYALVDTDGIDLDTITGIHGFTIDTSDNTDAGFYAAGNDYTVVVSAITVDSQTVNFIAARFSIDNRALLRPTVAQRTLDVTTGGNAGVDFDNIAMTGNGPFPAFGIIDIGTAQAADANGITLRAGLCPWVVEQCEDCGDLGIQEVIDGVDAGLRGESRETLASGTNDIRVHQNRVDISLDLLAKCARCRVSARRLIPHSIGNRCC